ncbi:MAG TPA: transporter [Gemmatimonadaceae bacterium]|nr:transporter [Gemmatimonadaceae bacterium]
MRHRTVDAIIGLAALALASTGATVGAQDPGSPHTAQPERPTIATHAGTVAPGWLEIESGVERDRTGSGNSALGTPTLFKFGLASHLQLDLAVTAVRPSAHQAIGAGDAWVGVKWRLLDDAPLVGDFALQPSLKLPTGSAGRGTGTGTTDASVIAISSHELGPVALDVNVGYTRTSAGGSAGNAMLWTISTGTTIAGPWALAAECFGYPGFDHGASVGVLAGPTYTVHPWFVADAGFIAHVAGDQPPALYAGLTWNVGRLR